MVISGAWIARIQISHLSFLLQNSRFFSVSMRIAVTHLWRGNISLIYCWNSRISVSMILNRNSSLSLLIPFFSTQCLDLALNVQMAVHCSVCITYLCLWTCYVWLHVVDKRADNVKSYASYRIYFWRPFLTFLNSCFHSLSSICDNINGCVPTVLTIIC